MQYDFERVASDGTIKQVAFIRGRAMTKRAAFVVTVAVALAIIRVLVAFTVAPEHPDFVAVYKAMAHVFVGWVGSLWWVSFKPAKRPFLGRMWGLVTGHGNQICGWAFWGLCILEIAAAVLSRI